MENISNFESKKQDFAKDFQNLLEKYEIKVAIRLDFPEYKILPDEVKLALIVINKHKNQFVLDFVESKENEN